MSIGIMRPVGYLAVATDGRDTLAMLRRRPDESFMDILQRLDAAIKKADEQNVRTDEINH